MFKKLGTKPVNFKEEAKQRNSLWKSLLYVLTKIKLVSVLSCLLFPEYTSKILKKERKKMFPITSKVTTDFFKKKTYKWLNSI